MVLNGVETAYQLGSWLSKTLQWGVFFGFLYHLFKDPDAIYCVQDIGLHRLCKGWCTWSRGVKIKEMQVNFEGLYFRYVYTVIKFWFFVVEMRNMITWIVQVGWTDESVVDIQLVMITRPPELSWCWHPWTDGEVICEFLKWSLSLRSNPKRESNGRLRNQGTEIDLWILVESGVMDDMATTGYWWRSWKEPRILTSWTQTSVWFTWKNHMTHIKQGRLGYFRVGERSSNYVVEKVFVEG